MNAGQDFDDETVAPVVILLTALQRLVKPAPDEGGVDGAERQDDHRHRNKGPADQGDQDEKHDNEGQIDQRDHSLAAVKLAQFVDSAQAVQVDAGCCFLKIGDVCHQQALHRLAAGGVFESRCPPAGQVVAQHPQESVEHKDDAQADKQKDKSIDRGARNDPVVNL